MSSSLGFLQALRFLHHGVEGDVYLGENTSQPSLKYKRSLKVGKNNTLWVEALYTQIENGNTILKVSTQIRGGKVLGYKVEDLESGLRASLHVRFWGIVHQLKIEDNGTKNFSFWGRNIIHPGQLSWISPQQWRDLDNQRSFSYLLMLMERGKTIPVVLWKDEEQTSLETATLTLESIDSGAQFPSSQLIFCRKTGRIKKTSGYIYPRPHYGRVIYRYPIHEMV
ncbi:MAG: hypothetical protein KDD35_12930 [Bdellovibrionales bacterium]|nr:hypothetical protein [Bdellovibrionales bacterium]